MNVEELREYCLSLKGVSECLPFDEYSLVFKVYDKMFALIPLDETELKISVKCDPLQVIDLREHYKSVIPAYHFNKKYWNCILINQGMDDETVKYWILHSLKEVLKKLPKKMQADYWGE